MKVSIVIRDSWDGWVLRKIGLRLVDELVLHGIEAEYVTSPNPNSDVNHFLHFAFAVPVSGSLTTTAITHVDDAIKAKRLKDILLNGIDGGICMSKYHMEELIDYGVPREKISWVLPALDNTQMRRIHFTIQCNCYADGRKNEDFFKKLARSIDLEFAKFSFYGTGWEETAELLEDAGAEVSIYTPSKDFAQDYVEMIKALESADFYVNTGWDEGSLGSLDAFINRTPMILSAQGYHLSIPDNQTQFFNGYTEFEGIIEFIRAEQAKKQKDAENMSWQTYAKNHIAIWQALSLGRSLPKPLIQKYGEGTQTFERGTLQPILNLSWRKTIRRASGILKRKLGFESK